MQRHSRADGKVSFIPRPNSRPGSMDRMSGAGSKPGRSASVGMRVSRDTSAIKKPLNAARARSQALSMTPINKASSYARMTTTPQRTPSGDRSSKSYIKSLERVQACVTVKDKRPLTSTAWQRNELSRIQNILSSRSGSDGSEGGAPAVMRPFTIAKFVEAVAQLISVFISDKHNITVTNYVTKLPHVSKKLLYPGVVSKSWLKTVNTLHTFPNALGLISYLVDLVQRFEAPVTDEWLYTNQDELSKLKRIYLDESWNRFQLSYDLKPVEDEYIKGLRELLGVDDNKAEKLKKAIEEKRALLNDPSEVALREDEARRKAQVTCSREALQAQRALHAQLQAEYDSKQAATAKLKTDLTVARVRYEASCEERAKLKQQLSEQPMSVKERDSLLEKTNYSRQILESRKRLLEQVTEMNDKKDIELSRLQMESMDICVDVNQRLIKLNSVRNCTDLAVDERDLIHESTSKKLSSSREKLTAWRAELAQKVREAERKRESEMRRRSQQSAYMIELQKKRDELRSASEKEIKQWRQARQEHARSIAAYQEEMRLIREETSHFARRAEVETMKAKELTDKWTNQEAGWQKKVKALRATEVAHKILLAEELDRCKAKRLNLANQLLSSCNDLLSDTENAKTLE